MSMSAPFLQRSCKLSAICESALFKRASTLSGGASAIGEDIGERRAAPASALV